MTSPRRRSTAIAVACSPISRRWFGVSPRYHKYTVGADLRQAAMGLMRTVNQAVHDKPRQSAHVERLVWQVDDYKLTLQLAMDVSAFKHSVKGAPAFMLLTRLPRWRPVSGNSAVAGARPWPGVSAGPASLSARAASACSAEVTP